jgi:chemotaxis protein MotB
MRTAWIALVLAWASGCGVPKGTHAKTVADLTSCQGELGSCATTRDEQATRLGAIEEELATARSERDKERAARQDAESQLSTLASNLSSTEKELGELRKQHDAAEKRLDAFRKLQERFRKLADTGRLEVGYRHGQMVLKLPAGILFASGRADLSEDGQAALAEVLRILLEFKDRRFIIAGHTDNLPIKSRKFRNNWELSTARAQSVLEFMVDSGFDPRNLGVAGYGPYDPVSTDNTEEGRQLNRRIEIILVPDLSELPTMTGDQT